MTHPSTPSLSRRRMFRYMAVAAGSALSLPLLARTAKAAAVGGPVAKAAVKYQDHPKGTSACANCANFIPGKSPSASGHCAIVSGDISSKGWCLAYASKG